MYICTNYQIIDHSKEYPLLDIFSINGLDSKKIEWAIFDVEVTTDGKFNQKFVRSLPDKKLDYSNVLSFIRSITTIENIVIAGSKNNFQDFSIARYTSRNDMTNFDVFIEFFDSTTWTFFSREKGQMIDALEVLFQPM